MSGIEDYPRETAELELALTRKGIALQIDWDNPVQLRQWAREALDYKLVDHALPHDDPLQEAKLEFFGIAQLMLLVMTESAGEGIETHGGKHWKAFGQALWMEAQSRNTSE